jgi:hypothetical protein
MRVSPLSTVLFALSAAVLPFALHAGDDKKDEKTADKKEKTEELRLWPRGPEIEKLKAELGLTDIDLHNLKAAVAGVDKKSAEVSAPENVKAAEEKVKKAKEALKAAEDELDQAKGGFNLLDERKKAAYEALPADKREKSQDLLHYKPKVEKAPKAEKKEKAEK